jgi:hypothetical protein
VRRACRGGTPPPPVVHAPRPLRQGEDLLTVRDHCLFAFSCLGAPEISHSWGCRPGCSCAISASTPPRAKPSCAALCALAPSRHDQEVQEAKPSCAALCTLAPSRHDQEVQEVRPLHSVRDRRQLRGRTSNRLWDLLSYVVNFKMKSLKRAFVYSGRTSPPGMLQFRYCRMQGFFSCSVTCLILLHIHRMILPTTCSFECPTICSWMIAE